MTASRFRSIPAGISFVLVLFPSLTPHRPHAATSPGPSTYLPDLGTFGTPSAQAHDVNDAGHVVGIRAPGSFPALPALFRDSDLELRRDYEFR
jgi:hypothetical protein